MQTVVMDRVSMLNFATYLTEPYSSKSIRFHGTSPYNRNITSYTRLSELDSAVQSLVSRNLENYQQENLVNLHKYLAKGVRSVNIPRKYIADTLTGHIYDNHWLFEMLGMPAYASKSPIVYDISANVVEIFCSILGTSSEILSSMVRYTAEQQHINLPTASKAILGAITISSDTLSYIRLLEFIQLPVVEIWRQNLREFIKCNGYMLHCEDSVMESGDCPTMEGYICAILRTASQYILDTIILRIEELRETSWGTPDNPSLKDCLVSISPGKLIYQNNADRDFPSFELVNSKGKPLGFSIKPKSVTQLYVLTDMIFSPIMDRMLF